MPRYWAMRTYKEENVFIYNELKEGRLRQGWGYRVDQNLEIIRQTLEYGKQLNKDQRDCWRGNRRMHPKEENSIQVHDIILLPNLPSVGSWLMAEVTGGYSFQIDLERGDFGHILEVKLLKPNIPINPHNEFVSASLRGVMNNPLRLWNLDSYKKDIAELLQAISRGKAVAEPSTEIERLLTMRKAVYVLMMEEIPKKFHAAEFELPIGKILRAIYGEKNVEHTAGSSEKGADFICMVVDDLGITFRVAVQVKMWQENVYSLEPLEQITKAYDNYEKISAGVIITFADSFAHEFEEKKLKTEKELNIPIRTFKKEEVVNLFMKYLPDFVSI